MADNGQPVAIPGAPDPEDVTFRELVRAGIIPPDLAQQQDQAVRRLRASRTRAKSCQQSGSDVIAEMRDEQWPPVAAPGI
ncbi:MAG TPA: hypothetical protein VF892_12065 [Pseudonocardiaceae bacterium]